ncbi:MAG: inositol monophosphatase family protein [Alphaproteobacteria bacterium]
MTYNSSLPTSALLSVMINAVKKVTRNLRRDFGELEHLQVTKKGLFNFVTTADKKSETVLINELSYAYPEYNFLSEEKGKINQGYDSDYSWIIDPLDGTNNFLHGIPHFAISVALYRENDILAGVVYDPIKDELYWAGKGRGAFVNQRRIRVSGRTHLNDCIIGLSHKNILQQTKQSFLTRYMGATSLDLCYVATGRFDGFYVNNAPLWDVAAGILLVKEAGGYAHHSFTNITDKSSVLACNPHIYPSFSEVLNNGN